MMYKNIPVSYTVHLISPIESRYDYPNTNRVKLIE